MLAQVEGEGVVGGIATDWDGAVCRPYFATGAVTGTGDAAGVAGTRSDG